MDNPASTVDLTNLGYIPIPADSLKPQTRLDQAWRALQLEIPSLESSIAAGRFTTDDVADVVVAAALRSLRNVDGTVEDSAALDDYRESRKHADSTEDIYFTAAELRRLTPAVFGAGSFKYS